MEIKPAIFIMFPVLILLLFAAIALLVLFIKLCIKKPWAAVIPAVVLLVLLAAVFIAMPHKRIVRHREIESMELILPDSGENTAAIWLPGIEDQFKANVYPSEVSAIRSVGLRIVEPVRQVFGDQALPAGFILFQGAHDRNLIEELGQAIAKVFPEINWTIKPETAAVQDNEIGIRLDLVNIQTQPAAWRSESENRVTSGTIRATVLAMDQQTSIDADFVEKPWVDDFSEFLNTNPNSRLLIAKSPETCLSEAEANNQAMNDACNQVGTLLINLQNPNKLSSNDILESGLILDRFVQSFDGSAGKIWRQALLIDTSAEKLKRLLARQRTMAMARRNNWARMFFSIAGLLVLITVVYVFLNAATKGYYAWSLRIAGIVLALIVIFLLFA